MRTFVMLALLGLARPALADRPPPTSDFTSLDRVDGASRAGAELTHMNLEGGGGELFRLEAYGQYVDPRYGVGGYASVPMALGTGILGGETGFELASIELGALYSHGFGRPGSGIVVRAGIAAPTAPDEADYAPYAALGRAETAGNAFSSGVMGRLGISPIVRAGIVFARADFGVDVHSEDSDVMVRYGAGIGVQPGPLAISVEAAGSLFVGDGHFEPYSAGTLAFRYVQSRVHPYLAIGTPLASDDRALFSTFLTVGADARF
jgi:hypothetical protein